MNLWARDVADNIFILMTFADNQRANCIDALNSNDVLKQCKRRIKINNSAFSQLSNQRNSDPFDQLFWNMGMNCFSEFFQSLEQVKPKPIEQSKEVLRKRDNVQTKIHHISMSLDSQLRKQQQIMDEKRFIKKNEAEINADKEVVYWAKEEKWVKQPAKNHLITTCVRHQKSCHPVCRVKDKRRCCMMSRDGHCQVCSCPYTEHINASYLYVLRSTEVRKSNWDSNIVLRQNYSDAKAAKTKSEIQLKLLSDDMAKIERSIQSKIALVGKLRNELEKIALRPHLSTIGDYIDQLIENEKGSKYRDREKIKLLKKLKQQEQIITHLHKTQELSPSDFKWYI